MKSCCASGQRMCKKIFARLNLLAENRNEVGLGLGVCEKMDLNANCHALPAQWVQAKPANPTGHVPLLPPALVRKHFFSCITVKKANSVVYC